MGLAMATNLQTHLLSTTSASNPLHYHNRTPSRGAPLAALGAVPHPTASSLAAAADIIFLSLADDAALTATLDAILLLPSPVSGDDEQQTLPVDLSHKIVVDTSTVHPSSSSAAAARLQERGAAYVAAPVFGASPVAARGELLFVVAGRPAAAVEAAVGAERPWMVGVMARAVVGVGEDVRRAGLVKTVGNFVTAGMMELISEAHVFAEKSGLGSEAMEALLEQQYGPLAFNMSKRLTTGAYMPPKGERPWSSLELALKDVGHGIKCAEEAGTSLEVGEVALRHLEEAKKFSDAQGRPLDSSSMYGVLRQQAGLPFETNQVQQRDTDDA
ncbi:6-phosphogluconate dehydrogenase family protein [Diplodia corticola]|uniref:6-phosphogluconate dehydrogenase family protein n=1 Tax=Diplodia corticola TaxID=236234 RepID=A0A1J9R037_9PEZI|nr:6-phosphogluconate dehydrogenase family protein [Diplodia corticola]OJD33992.1 6-phosphogluconate dehydrogenase family protein [Diplodia corticola]